MGRPKPAQAVLAEGRVAVQDVAQANRLHNQLLLGEPQPGNTLRLSLVEAAWAVARGRLAVTRDATPMAASDLVRAAALAEPGAEAAFLVYCDLRERGLVVRHDGDALAVWPRGKGIDGRPEYLVHPASGNEPVTASQLQLWAAAGIIVGLVDGDGVVTHYSLSVEAPAGDVKESALAPTPAQLLQDRVLVADEARGADLRAAEHAGTPSPLGLLLSFPEAEVLRRRGALTGIERLPAVAAQAGPGFEVLVAAYAALRHSGVVARSGFKFGTHLRGYRGDPEAGHAEWLVQCAPANEALAWNELSRGIRLAHGVRKRFLLAIVEGPGVAFVGFSWFKP